MTDIRTTFNHTSFDVRACGFLRDENKVLVSLESDGQKTLTGGAVKIGESTEEAVVREFFEETNLHVTVNHLIGVIENFFYFKGQPYQQLIFVYDLSLTKGRPQVLASKEKPHVCWEKTTDVTGLKPSVLNEWLRVTSGFPFHVIHRESL